MLLLSLLKGIYHNHLIRPRTLQSRSSYINSLARQQVTIIRKVEAIAKILLEKGHLKEQNQTFSQIQSNTKRKTKPRNGNQKSIVKIPRK